MQITYLSYFLASIIAYLGLLLGIILIRLAPEEQRLGKKYFILLKKILFFLIIVSILFFYKVNIILTTVLLLFMIILMLNRKINLDKLPMVYILLGVILFLSSKILNLFVIESVLIFLFGVPASSLIFKRNNYYDVFIRNLWFFIPVTLLHFVF